MNFKSPQVSESTFRMGKTLFKIVTAIALTVTFSLVNVIPWNSQIAFAKTLPKPATDLTVQSNEAFKRDLPFENTDDFDFATRGFIGKLPDPVKIRGEGKILPAWNLEQYQFLLENKDGERLEIPTGEDKVSQLREAPPTVNPSLWRNSQLNMQHGLYEVVPGIYQLRGYDLAEMTLVEGNNGWILIDPLTSNETAEAALLLANENIGKTCEEGSEDTCTEMVLPKHPDLKAQGSATSELKELFPVSAVIYTHSHVDHYAGGEGVIDISDIKSDSNPKGVAIYAPEGFLEEAISENVLAGNVMTRRASYMYGNLIRKNEKGQVDGGLGKTTSAGTASLIPPTDIIDMTGEKVTIDGVDITFQNVPGSEAPAEMMFYFPEYHALCASEDATHTMHNLYTLRGAKVRDALGWSKYLSETIELFGDNVEVVFASHHWPTWDNPNTENNEVVDYLKKQRDLYKYIHDQTLRLANQGETMLEIAEQLELPDSLAKEWYNRGSYGTLNHNVKAVYQRYLGWFDGNPANLYMLPPEKSGKKYIEYMGGAQVAIDKARTEFEAVEITTEEQTETDQGIDTYRWVAKVMSDVVFGYCKESTTNKLDPYFGQSPSYCEDAKNLEADALEQLGYMAESGPWRNFFLTGAKELRNGVPTFINAPQAPSLDNLHSMTSEMLFDYMSIRLNGYEAAEHQYTFNIIFPDVNEQYLLSVENGVLNYTDKLAVNPDTTIIMNRPYFDSVIFENNQLQAQHSTTKENKTGQQLICSFVKTSRDGSQKYVCMTMGDTSGSKNVDEEFSYAGDLDAFNNFISLLDNFEFWFNIVLP